MLTYWYRTETNQMQLKPKHDVSWDISCSVCNFDSVCIWSAHHAMMLAVSTKAWLGKQTQAVVSTFGEEVRSMAVKSDK